MNVPRPAGPDLDQGIDVSRLLDLFRQLWPIRAVGQVRRDWICAHGDVGFGTALVLSGMDTVAIPDNQVRTSTCLLVPGQEVGELALAGALVGVVEVEADHGTGPSGALVKPSLQEPTVLLLRDGREEARSDGHERESAQ